MELQPILFALRRSKTSALLVAAQVALTLAIITNALFVVRERLNTAARPTGVDEAGLFQLQYAGSAVIDDRTSMTARDLETLRGIPGVIAAGQINSMPMGRSGSSMGLTVDPSRPDQALVAAAYFSGDSLISLFGLNLIEGRDFEANEIRELDSRRDRVGADAVILSKRVAGRLFPNESAVGKTIYLGSGDSAEPMRVVGVVEQLMSSRGDASDDTYDTFILPNRYLTNSAHYAVRTAPADRERVLGEAIKLLGALRTDRVLIHKRTMDEIRERRYRHERSGAGLLIAVTIGLLLVTASGIVGVASLWVSQRKKQIGVRRALGARRRDIIRYFITENLVITTAGISIGFGLAIALNQMLMSYAELARLPMIYVGGGMLAVWALGIAAVLGPAWRAASVPPAIATRSA